ncbi:MAG: DUF3105 domain-containing protein [Actinomycetota bacterium]|nr:DUF3105 domain-containing protein [Actinomycetota bacterium]
MAIPVKQAGCTLKKTESAGRRHVTGKVRYRSNPPTSGPHAPQAAEDGASAESPSTEALVHSLEHRRVVVQSRPTVPDETKTRYRDRGPEFVP